MLAPATYRQPPPVQLLPSADSALALARGEPGAAWAVLGHLATRTALIAPCAIAAGGVVGVGAGKSVLIALACAVGIEAAVLALAYRQVRQAKAPAAPKAPEAPQPQAAAADSARPDALKTGQLDYKVAMF